MFNTMSIADELNTLVNCKEDMKSALIEKGVTPEGGLSTYADAIDKIEIKLEEKYVGLKFGNSDFTEAPNIDTSLYTDMYHMFYGCTSLTTIPLLDTSSVTNMQGMFEHCDNLTTIPQFNTSKVTNMIGMFYDCDSLTTIPQLDTSNVTDMKSMFEGCTSLESVPELDCSNVEDVTYMFYECDKLKNIEGLKNLGMRSNLIGTNSYTFIYSNVLSLNSVINLFNSLYDRFSVSDPVLNIRLPENIFDYESEYVKQQTIAIAVNKGWSVSW